MWPKHICGIKSHVANMAKRIWQCGVCRHWFVLVLLTIQALLHHFILQDSENNTESLSHAQLPCQNMFTPLTIRQQEGRMKTPPTAYKQNGAPSDTFGRTQQSKFLRSFPQPSYTLQHLLKM